MPTPRTTFVDVILPLALGDLFTYRIPKELEGQIHVGQRIVVQFGKGSKFYTAIVRSIHNRPPQHYQAKYIEDVLDDMSTINDFQFKFWDWISDYYLCAIGEVMSAAIPGGLKITSDTNLVLNEGYQDNLNDLNDREYQLIEILEQRHTLNLKEVSEILEIKNVHAFLKPLFEQHLLVVVEEIHEKFKPKIARFLSLTENAGVEENLKVIFNQLEKAPKQLEALMVFMQLCGQDNVKRISKTRLQKEANTSSTIISQLVKKDIFSIEEIVVGRLQPFNENAIPSNKLNEGQAQALSSVKNEFESKDIVLLHGVTSSGKTEVYIKLIEEIVAKGEQVLYLLPEIALTTQLIMRLQKHFGEVIGVYHSKFNEQERVEVWQSVFNFNQNNSKPSCQVVLGARSSIFLPFQKLGLIIIDEEHESAFKQFDPAPRYNARDAATMLAKIHGAKVLLGSATPSVESYWNAKMGRYGYVIMDKRFGGIQMPEIFCADVADDHKRKKMNGHFSPMLLKAMEETLDRKEQVILFQNRRGYAPIMLCETCGNAPQCKNCDVSLTYHKYFNHFTCHYCNYSIPVPELCPSCNSPKITLKGFGTEKIEEDLSLLFPNAKVARMDLDSTRSKNAHQNIITDFEDRVVDILVGTQMIAKGLDFDHVGLVGVLNADNLLQFPDFRAFERSFQLMSQVAGRAGRKKRRGKVIIQSFNPNHEIIRNVIDYDYEKMFKNELLERRNFKYPPFYRLIQFTLLHRDAAKLNTAVYDFHNLLQDKFGARVLGPQTPPVSRIRNFYHKNLLLKIERDKSLKAVKTTIKQLINSTVKNEFYKGVRIKIDVDPG